MTASAFSTQRSAKRPHGLAAGVAAVASVFLNLIEVFAEAESRSSAARERFPFAD